MRTVERNGVTTGRWPKYDLIVDGVNLGRVARVTAFGRDGLMGRRQPRTAGWEIHGVTVETQERAEAMLIERAERFGHLAPTPARG